MKSLSALVFTALLAIAAVSASPRRVTGEDAKPIIVDEDLCVYTVYVGTGTAWRSWTDGGAVVGLKLCGPAGDCLSVSDVAAWGGKMWPGHEYFQWGAVDAFSGRARCLGAPPCSVEVVVSGLGSGRWFCEFVQVTGTGPGLPCRQRMFMVQQWLSDEPPHKLTAVRDECGGNETDRVYL